MQPEVERGAVVLVAHELAVLGEQVFQPGRVALLEAVLNSDDGHVHKDDVRA